MSQKITDDIRLSENSGSTTRRNVHDEYLRDQFAMAALQGLIANPANSGVAAPELVSFAYDYADAMIEERQKDVA